MFKLPNLSPAELWGVFLTIQNEIMLDVLLLLSMVQPIALRTGNLNVPR